MMLVALWWLSLSSGVDSVLSSRRSAVLEESARLQDSFATIQQLGEVMLKVSLQEAGSGLKARRTDELREQGRPFYEFYYVDSAGVPVIPEESKPPDWLVSDLLRLESEEAVFRPLPPGYSQASSNWVSSPDNYLVFAGRLSDGRRVAWLLNWDFVFGPWLDKQLKGFGLEGSLEARFQPPGEVLRQLLESEESWNIPVETFLPQQPHQLDRLELRVDNSQVMKDEMKRKAPYLGAGLALLLGFACVLWLASRALRREAEFAEARTRFVSQVSHELRTPITALEMYLEILSDGLVKDQQKVREYHQILRRESQRLKSLVENLLTVGLVESGHWTPKKSCLEVNELVRSVVAGELLGNRACLVKPSEVPVDVEADKDALMVVLANLLQNALKYSYGPVEVTVVRLDEQVEVSVWDRGEGLSKRDYEEVFRPYFRAGQAGGKKPGVGLGLALVKQIVEAHGGKVSGQARQGGGSVFSVLLPVQV